MYADAKRVLAGTVTTGGAGYKVGEALTVAGGTLLDSNTAAAAVQVTAVDGSGAVTAFSWTTLGGYTIAPAAANTVTGGSGSGCELALTFTLYWPNAPWVSVSGPDIRTVLSEQVLTAVDLDLSTTGTLEGQPIDPTATNTRSAAVVALVVEQVRGAIRQGNRVPLSVTAATVPPELKMGVLQAAAWMLVSSTPSLQMAVVTEKGVYAPMGAQAKQAQDQFAAIAKGNALVSYPSDPDPAWKPRVRYGSSGESADLTTYGPSGWTTVELTALGQP